MKGTDRRGTAAPSVTARHVIQSVAVTGAVMIVGLVSGIVAARTLGVDGRGTLAAVILWPAVLTSLAEVGLPTAFTYLSSSHGYARHDLARGTVPLLAVQSALLYVVGVPVILAALGGYSGDVRATAIGFLLAYAPLYLGVRYLTSLNQGAGRFHVFNFVRLLVPVLYTVSLVALLLFGVVGVRVFAAAYVGSWAVALVALVAVSSREIRSGAVRPRVDWATARLSWSVGRRAYFGSLAPVDTLQLDVLATTALLGAREAGLYYVATSLGALVRAWGTTLGALALAKVAAAPTRDEAISLMALFTRVTLLISGAFAVVAFVFAEPLLSLVYGRAFASAYVLVRILAVGMLAASVRYALGDGLRGLGAHSEATRAEVYGWLAGGVALAGLLPLWGVTGVAVAVSVSYITTLVVMLGFCSRSGARPLALLVPAFADFSSGWSMVRATVRGREP